MFRFRLDRAIGLALGTVRVDQLRDGRAGVAVQRYWAGVELNISPATRRVPASLLPTV
jgi:hypothetical protein